MDDGGMNHYEQQLYTVFKTFDVDNSETLDRAAVLQLCDALQLEGRGAALVETLFQRRAERVTFATFRNGLLGVLGAEPTPAPEPEPEPEPEPAREPEPSDEDSSGREVAPKFVFGSKKYGRRSRPARADEAAPRAASASRLDAGAAPARASYRRSASAMDRAPELLEHERRLDRAQAAALCRELRVHAVDPGLVDRIFDEAPAGETTVGEFFDRLNAALTPLAAGEPAPEPPPEPPDADDAEAAVTGETVAEAWERAGVHRPRRLLAELGFTGAALSPDELERALDEEISALPVRDERSARPLLQRAALALSRLRRGEARARAAAAAAERDKLRADLAEANRRAQLLAQDVDEQHARLEAERQTALRQLEARHAEAARAASEDAAAERERAAAARTELEAELARRADGEARLRAELAALRLRADQLERRAGAAEERAAVAERERARAENEARAARVRAASDDEARGAARAALERQLQELRAENARLRDRADELAAGLEARRAPPAAGEAAAASWRDEAELNTAADATQRGFEECDSSPPSMEHLGSASASACPRCAAAAPCAAAAAASQTAPAAGDTLSGALLEELQRKHEAEKTDLNNLIATLESSVEELREEYERCEEYWAGKLAEERALAAEEAAAGDARLAALLARVAEYEAAYRPRAAAAAAPALPPLRESPLEAQYAQLEQEFEEFKVEAARELAAARERPACACARRQARPASDGEQHPADTVDMAAARRTAPSDALSHAEHEPHAPHAARAEHEPHAPHAARAEHEPHAPHAAGDAPAHQRRQQPFHAPGGGGGGGGGGCACAALAAAWRRACAAEGAGLRARAAHAERAAARLLARLHAADALVAELYRENCQLQHARPEPRLL